MNFDVAILACRLGASVGRLSWASNTHLTYAKPIYSDEILFQQDILSERFTGFTQSVGGVSSTWLPTLADVLASDWSITSFTTTILDTASYPNDRYAAGNYLAFQAVNDTSSTRSQSIVADTSMFPNNTILNWSWPADAGTAVRSWNAIDYGNYLNTTVPTPIPSAKVSNVTNLVTNHNATFNFAAGGANVALDLFLFTSSDSTAATMACEIEVYFHTPTSTKAFADSVTSLGTYTSAAINGTPSITWNVRKQASNFFGTPYFLVYPANQADYPVASFDLKAFFSWLVTGGQITGNEYFNGLGFGSEPLNGAGSLTVNTLGVNYTRTIPVVSSALPAKTNLIAITDFRDASWTKGGVTVLSDGTGIQDTDIGTAEVRQVFRNGNTASASTALKFQVDVDVSAGWPFVEVQLFRQDFGKVAMAYFDVANLAALSSSSSTYSGVSVDAQLLDNGKTRLYVNFTTDASTTAISAVLRPATGVNGENYTGVAGKTLKLANPFLYVP